LVYKKEKKEKKTQKKQDKLVSSGFIFYIFFIHILYIYRHLDTNEISTQIQYRLLYWQSTVTSIKSIYNVYENVQLRTGDRRGGDRMVVRFTTTFAISAYHHFRCEFESHLGEVYSIQHYVIKFVTE